MKIAGITVDSLVDGPGIRTVIFAQGCDLACENCHNPESWDMDGGREYDPAALARKIKRKRPGREMMRGVTFSGGEPFLQPGDFALVAKSVKRMGWDVISYTGRTYEDLVAKDDPDTQALLNELDYLIDGPYIEARRGLDLRFRGSDNQRIIDMAKTRATGAVVLAEI